MSKEQTSLSIIRPVQNIGVTDIAKLEYELNYRNDFSDPDQFRKFFKERGKLRATLVSQGEVRRLQEAHKHETRKSSPEELRDYLGEILPPFSQQSFAVATLPSAVEQRGRNGRTHMLTIASSAELVQERLLVKAAILGFYGLTPEVVSPDIWLEDERMGSVCLVRTHNTEGKRITAQLQAIFEAEGSTTSLLPAETVLAPTKANIVCS